MEIKKHESILENIGLTKSEVAVYFALLELGESSTGPIINKAGIAAGKAYLVLGKLLQKGLATHVIRGNTKYFHASDPERLLDYMRDKEQELKQKENKLREILPDLKARFASHREKSRAEVYEGIKGFKTLYEWILKELNEGDSISIFGVVREVHELLEPYLLDWNKRRIEKGVFMRIIYSHKSKEYGKLREKMRLTQVRYMKEELQTLAWIDVFKDYVVTINVHGEPICFLIKNKESADSYQKYFELLWKQARK